MGYPNYKDNLIKTNDLFVCETHFKHRYKNYTGINTHYKSLTINAIPTEHVPYKNPLEKLNLTQETQAVSDKYIFEKEQDTTEMVLDKSTKLKVDENKINEKLGYELNAVINLHKKLSEKPHHCSMEFTDEVKTELVSIYMENTSTYQMMEMVIGLPSVAEIKKFIPSKPEVISEHFMSLLINKVEYMSPDSVNCALCLQLLSIEPSLDYDPESDIVFGCWKSTNDTSNFLTASKYALVAMARGICDDWHQIVSFVLLPVNKDQIDFNKFISPWLKNIVIKLVGIGLTVNVLIPSTDDLLINAFLHMRISDIEPYLQINGKKIFYLFDPLNLLKIAMLNMRGVQSEYMSTMWSHIRTAWEIDESRDYRLAPDLTKGTFDKKPNQSNQAIFQKSAQILSINTATVIEMFIELNLMNESAKRTATFIRKINCLFDTNYLNSFYRKKIYANMFSSRLFEMYDNDIWVDIVTYFKQLQLCKSEIIKPPNRTIEYNGVRHLVDCIITTLHNIRLIRENNEKITPQFLNQDPLVAIVDDTHLKLGIGKKIKAKELIQVMKENLVHSALLHDRKKQNRLAMEKFAEKANKLIEKNNMIYKKNIDLSDFSFKHVNSVSYIATYIINKICQGDNFFYQSQVSTLKGASSVKENNKIMFIPDNEFFNFLGKLRRSFLSNIKFAMCSDNVVQTLMDSFEHIRSNASWEIDISDEHIMFIKRAYFTIATINLLNNKH